jgi:hypothetical protein|tara:strand:- start:4640 stop:4846 length:207 start_codon:yes stop_codon:yes gene_type:complete
MGKMRIFKFLKDDKEIEEVESSSFKKAVKSFQNKVKQSMVYVEWISKKGQEMTKWQKLPLGRKDKINR